MAKYFYLAIVLVSVVFVPCIFFIETRAANISGSVDTDTTLSQLENRFFEHAYNLESAGYRIDRLEDFVFGAHQTGSTDSRIKRLLSTIPQDNNTTNNAAPGNNIVNQPAAQRTSKTQNQTISPKQNPAFDYGSYPRISNLEQELLGHTFKDDFLSDRIKRLEIKAYGAPSSSSDLCQRVDLLDDYAQRHDLYGEHKSATNPPASAMTFNSTTPVNSNSNDEPTSNDPAYPWKASAQPKNSASNFIGSAEERVSMMEAQVFHHTYTDKTLDQRLKKLAKKILPNQDIASLPASQQTVQLWNALHPNEKDQVASLVADANQAYANSNDSQNDPSPKHGSWLHKLANAGGSFAGTSMGPNSNIPTTYGTNTPYFGSIVPANSRFIGASVGPGAGPAGLPIGFW